MRLTRRSTTAPLALAAALLATAAGLQGCRGDRSDKPPRQFFPGMDDQPKWKPQEATPFFADGRTMREPPIGAVPFGRAILTTDDPWAKAVAERDEFLQADPEAFTGRAPDGTWVVNIPDSITVDAALLDTGQRKFNTYCAVCHGYAGDGLGMVGRKWSYPVPSFHDPKYADRTLDTGKDGYLWQVARQGLYDAQGVQKMPGYAHAITEHEAWGVIAYMRALQASRAGTIDQVPEREREILRSRSTAPQASAPAPAGQPLSQGGDS